MASASSTGGAMHDAMNYVLDNKLSTIIYSWAGGVAGVLTYQWTRPIPTSLKIIHTRVYAQALTLGAMGALAAVEIYAQSQGRKKVDKEAEIF